jgi:predicted AAA+ superfamily ATPase
LRELIGSEPAVILIDEIAPYLRKVAGRNAQRAGEQLLAFMTSLMKAVESSALTLRSFSRWRSAVTARRVTPTAVRPRTSRPSLPRPRASPPARRRSSTPPKTTRPSRSFVVAVHAYRPSDKAKQVIAAYKALWDANRDCFRRPPAQDRRVDEFEAGYPLHPELVKVLTQKTGTLGNFQRVRGMLRLLARTVARLWQTRPADAYAIHTHHIDLGFEPIRLELVTRLKQDIYVPAIKAEIAAVDQSHHWPNNSTPGPFKGLPSYGSYVARCVFMHTLAFNETLRGLNRGTALRHPEPGD